MEWEREQWVRDYQAGASVSEIAETYRISRKAVYKWLARYEAYGAEGGSETVVPFKEEVSGGAAAVG